MRVSQPSPLRPDTEPNGKVIHGKNDATIPRTAAPRMNSLCLFIIKPIVLLVWLFGFRPLFLCGFWSPRLKIEINYLALSSGQVY